MVFGILKKEMKISAIIPVYNGKKYLSEAILSVIQQTLSPMELILVDDGSTDGSIESIRDVTADFPIRIIRQENAGQSAARNHGVREAVGDFIALLDQDDIWYPEHLEKLAKAFDAEHLGWVYSNLDEVDKEGKMLRAGLLNHCGVVHPHKSIEEMIARNMYILPSTTLMRKKAFLEVGMFDEGLSGYEDDDLFLRMFMHGWRQKYLPESLSFWRKHQASCSAGTEIFKSGKAFGNKVMSTLSEASVDAAMGKRLYYFTLGYYAIAMKKRDFAECKKLWEDLKHYASLAPQHFRYFRKGMLFLRKFPKFFRHLSRLKQLLALSVDFN